MPRVARAQLAGRPGPGGPSSAGDVAGPRWSCTVVAAAGAALAQACGGESRGRRRRRPQQGPLVRSFVPEPGRGPGSEPAAVGLAGLEDRVADAGVVAVGHVVVGQDEGVGIGEVGPAERAGGGVWCPIDTPQGVGRVAAPTSPTASTSVGTPSTSSVTMADLDSSARVRLGPLVDPERQVVEAGAARLLWPRRRRRRWRARAGCCRCYVGRSSSSVVTPKILGSSSALRRPDDCTSSPRDGGGGPMGVTAPPRSRSGWRPAACRTACRRSTPRGRW